MFLCCWQPCGGFKIYRLSPRAGLHFSLHCLFNWCLLLEVNDQVSQRVSVGQRQVSDGLVHLSYAVVVIRYLWKGTNKWAKPIRTPKAERTEGIRGYKDTPAASMKGRLRLNVRRGSLRFLRKSLRTPVMTWTSSTLLSTGTVLQRRNFSFSSFTWRSAPDRRYKPVWGGRGNRGKI